MRPKILTEILMLEGMSSRIKFTTDAPDQHVLGIKWEFGRPGDNSTSGGVDLKVNEVITLRNFLSRVVGKE